MATLRPSADCMWSMFDTIRCSASSLRANGRRSGTLIPSHADQARCSDTSAGQRVAIENPSHYLRIDGQEWDEIGFLTELVRRTGCGLLLDVNNVYVSSRNLGFDALDYLDGFPGESVMEIHLAGHTLDPALGASLLIDSHDAPIAPEVWGLYRHLVERIGARPTLIERDGNVPAFDSLLGECQLAATELRRVAELAGLPS